MTNKHLTQEEKQEIYSLGFKAREDGNTRSHNPYHEDTEEYEEWDYGYMIARASGA